MERKMSHLNIAFDRYTSVGTVMHYILVISSEGWREGMARMALFRICLNA